MRTHEVRQVRVVPRRAAGERESPTAGRTVSHYQPARPPCPAPTFPVSTHHAHIYHRYLAENATPEWKRAYIDYRAAKKAIKRVTERLTKVPDPPTTGGPINALSRIATRTKGDHGKGDGNASDSSEDGDHGPASTKIRRTFTLGQGSVRSVGSGGGGGSAPAPASGGVSGGTSNVPSPRPIAAGISTGTGTVLGSSWRNSPSSLTPASALGRVSFCLGLVDRHRTDVPDIRDNRVERECV